jgi:hypothetical protein
LKGFVAQKVMKLKTLENKLFHKNYLGFKVVFRCFFKKSHFNQVIHGYLGQTQSLGARI